MSPGKIIHHGIYSLTETLRAPPKSHGKVARERIPGELSPTTYPERHVARDEFTQRQVARERREMSLGIVEDQMCSMDTVFNCVIPYIQNGEDRNSVSLVCHKWNEIDGFTRKHVIMHMRYAPTLSRLFKRFLFLVSLTLKGIKNTKTSIDLPQWIREIAIKFTHLKSLRIRQLVIRDSDLELLAKNQDTRERPLNHVDNIEKQSR
ncbi:ribonuclease H-like domain, reverse transcriptase, RNA-dependent DNA polymerase [Tanacetum coccineum]|uniref:Ribonuclease H-like domain, reverse transcriptase, RNA-dependent DNA polymerase n=1 Tax=Tanacetum coccineum TaxID=301880 RepID=A0ABQ4YGF2_9ASTR